MANSMAAVTAGIRHVQATINGYGERCGNANMVSILANLALKTANALVPAGGGDLADLTELSRSVAEIANVAPLDYQPYVGRSAFAHKGGVHGAAVAKVERSYQHVDPATVGNEGRLVVSELGGRANTKLRAEQLGHRLEGVDPRELSQLIKQLEADGLAFEGAEASFELLVRRHGSGYVAPFRIVDYTCLVEQRDGRELLAEATVKVEVDGEVLHTAADGNGPVNALDAALRKALGAFYPQLDAVHLVDYKVRILDGGAATAARTRVVIDSADGTRDVVDDGQRHEHHRGVGQRARRLARVRHLEGRRRAAPARRTPLRDRPARAGRRRRDPPEVAPMTDTASPTLHLERWTVSSGSNVQSRGAVVLGAGRPPVGRRRRGQRTGRRAVPRRRRGARGRPDRPPAARRLRRPRDRRGARRGGPGHRPDRPAGIGHRRPGDRQVHRQLEQREHHRRVDRGLHHGDRRAPRRGPLAGRDRRRRQPRAGPSPRRSPARRGGPSSTRTRRSTTRSPGSSAEAVRSGRWHRHSGGRRP